MRMENVHGFEGHQQDYHQVQVSTAMDGRYDGLPEWGSILLEDRSEEWLSPDLDQGRG